MNSVVSEQMYDDIVVAFWRINCGVEDITILSGKSPIRVMVESLFIMTLEAGPLEFCMFCVVLDIKDKYNLTIGCDDIVNQCCLIARKNLLCNPYFKPSPCSG